jgi:hypothetical protein
MASWEALVSQLISWRKEHEKVRKDKSFFRGSQTMRNMDMDNNIPSRKNMNENK